MQQHEFEGFYHSFVKRIYRYVFFRVGGNTERAQDLTQDIFLKAYEAFERFDPSRGQAAWIYTIARNHLINSYAKERPKLDIEEVSDHLLFSEDGRTLFADSDAERRLCVVIDGLEAEESRLVRMKYLEGWSFDDLAEVFGKTSGALRVQAGRVMKKLREQLSRE